MTVDQEARDMAAKAYAKISGHEDVCAVRWAAAMATMDDVKKTLKDRSSFETWAMRTALILLVAIVGYLWSKVY